MTSKALLITYALTSALHALGSATSFTPGPGFDAREATIDGIHRHLYNGQVTCRDVVSAFLARIEEFNPKINAVLSLNPSALEDADRLDSAESSWDTKGHMHCIPVLLKDNYDAVGMPTTAGSRALANLMPTTDAPVVSALKSAGAIILGKVNMHEMALEGISVSSLGGQTLNPYDLSRTPGGSSGGSGAAIAANLALIATGTDTVNSLRSPASANNLYSFRPTRGLISRAGVVPVGYTQDALGAMGRSVSDIATVLSVMASIGYDSNDNATALKPSRLEGKDYRDGLFGGSLQGKRLGVLMGAYNFTPTVETTPVLQAMAAMENLLRSEGAQLVNITSSAFDMATLTPAVDVQSYEYREMLNEYLGRKDLEGEPRPKSFGQVYSGTDFLVIPKQYEHIKSAHTRSTSDPEYHAKKKLIKELTESLHEQFHLHELDAIIYPEQRNLVVKLGSESQVGRNGILAAVTGSPVVAIPAGWSGPDANAPLGVPIGMEILGLPWSEDKLLNLAALISESSTKLRKPPHSTNRSVLGRCYSNVPSLGSSHVKVDRAYPLGVLEQAGRS